MRKNVFIPFFIITAHVYAFAPTRTFPSWNK